MSYVEIEYRNTKVDVGKFVDMVDILRIRQKLAALLLDLQSKRYDGVKRVNLVQGGENTTQVTLGGKSLGLIQSGKIPIAEKKIILYEWQDNSLNHETIVQTVVSRLITIIEKTLQTHVLNDRVREALLSELRSAFKKVGVAIETPTQLLHELIYVMLDNPQDKNPDLLNDKHHIQKIRPLTPLSSKYDFQQTLDDSERNEKIDKIPSLLHHSDDIRIVEDLMDKYNGITPEYIARMAHALGFGKNFGGIDMKGKELLTKYQLSVLSSQNTALIVKRLLNITNYRYVFQEMDAMIEKTPNGFVLGHAYMNVFEHGDVEITSTLDSKRHPSHIFVGMPDKYMERTDIRELSTVLDLFYYIVTQMCLEASKCTVGICGIYHKDSPPDVYYVQHEPKFIEWYYTFVDGLLSFRKNSRDLPSDSAEQLVNLWQIHTPQKPQ
jgi:hypothetical protein